MTKGGSLDTVQESDPAEAAGSDCDELGTLSLCFAASVKHHANCSIDFSAFGPGMQLMTKGSTLDTVQESEPAEAAGSESEEHDTNSLQTAASEALTAFPDWQGNSRDCVDTSANVWETLAPLTSSANSQSIGHGLDFIAP